MVVISVALLTTVIVMVTVVVVSLVVVSIVGWTQTPVTVNNVYNTVTSIELADTAAPIKIAVINLGPQLDAEVISVVNATQKQTILHFEPFWDINAKLEFFATADVPSIPGDYWRVIVSPNADIANALGYHDVDANGKPIGKVFVNDSVAAGVPWSVVFSHEVLEIMSDPYANLVVFRQNSNTQGLIVAYESADPVQGYYPGYLIDGVAMSNFVTPAWFGTFSGGSGTVGPWDYLGVLSGPLEIAPGGYVSFFDVTNGSGWQIATAMRKDIVSRDTLLFFSPDTLSIFRAPKDARVHNSERALQRFSESELVVGLGLCPRAAHILKNAATRDPLRQRVLN